MQYSLLIAMCVALALPGISWAVGESGEKKGSLEQTEFYFKSIDKDKDMAISHEEYQVFQKKTFNKLDADGNEFLTREECEYACHLQTPSSMISDIEHVVPGMVFKHSAMDEDSDGKVTPKEYDEYTMKLFKEADKDHNEALSIDEYESLEIHAEAETTPH